MDESAIDPHDPTSCALCPGCAERLYRLEAALDGTRADIRVLAVDLARLMPIADLLGQVSGGDGQAPPSVLELVRAVMGR